ncbi:hypothetical protein Q8A67_005280 [Cirrhinus molitorella]|uniref:Ig-like domain-containing protein n=1 Tax=Cirrhinus molitorella TaxID=172907 RepID=A0AA88Q7U4_9TELE|nr:hypothetical protein Q8A67_005280 [Cirrhinus molitorella]
MKIFWTLTLLMIPGVLSSISVTGYSGREIIITCRYDGKYTANAKYFCKGWWGTTCSDLIKTEQKQESVRSGRFSLYDDRRAAVFTVTIRDLSEWDSGTYQCGVDKSGETDLYTEVNLNITTETNYHRTQSPLSSLSFSSAETPLITPASPVTGSSLIIIVSALLLLIITVILTVILWRRRQSHNADSAPKSSHATNGNSKAVSHGSCDYGETENTHKQLPTNPSDSSEHSQVLITSEDLDYTVVNFQKKADCPVSVSLRNKQDYCEYAAVNHNTA